MIRGDIYYVKLENEGVGSEQVGSRYGVIVQNNTGNKYSNTVIIALITGNINKAKIPTHIEINSINSGIDNPSVVMCEQLRTVDKLRLTEKVGHLNMEKKQELDIALGISIGLDVDKLIKECAV